MARYQKRLDVWALSQEERARLQPGQHITAGGARGVYLGQTRNGTDVAMWEKSVPARLRAATLGTLRTYAKTYA